MASAISFRASGEAAESEDATMTTAIQQEASLPRIPDSEFIERTSRLHKKMRERGIDLLVAYSNELDPGHVRYLADVVGINESAAIVVPADADPIVCVGQACQAWGKYKSRQKDVRIFPEVGEVAGTEYLVGEQHRLGDLFQTIAASSSIRKIGTVGRLIFPQIIYAQLQKVFPQAQIVDAEPMVFELRQVKSENEIACIRKAAEICDAAQASVTEKVRPGWTELDIMAEIVANILRAGAEDTAATWTPMIPSGRERSSHCMNRNTMRKVEEGEKICLQTGATYEGYNSALATPLVLGAIPKEIRHAVLSACDAMDAIVGKLRHGATSKEVNCAGRAVLNRTGYAKYSPYAMVHNIGCLECESPWMPDDRDFPLVEGMAVCIDVFLFQLEWGSFRLENTLSITANGADLLTHFNDRFVRAHFS